MQNCWPPIEFSHNKCLFIETPPARLVELALRENPHHSLSSNGALVVKTGKFTGRAAQDKYVSISDWSEKNIDWNNGIEKMSPQHFLNLRDDILKDLDRENFGNVYLLKKSVSAFPKYALSVQIITTSASHALFCHNMFRQSQEKTPLGTFSIYHHPLFKMNPEIYGTKSPTAVAINFETNEIIIVGTLYSGEIKKSIFSVMNCLLPDHNVLPMHAGANQSQNGNTSLFFGLSGTGKTTLSTDEGTSLIGDDEHGLSDEGLFNLEGGCYAKTYGLTEEREPEIFFAANQFLSLLENVVLDPSTSIPQYNDKSITENGRATYSLDKIPHLVCQNVCQIPNNIFFLSADALGVLPAIGKLTPDQAMYYFLSGYTAKLAGTEAGGPEIKMTFSHCFGAPFMMRKANVYGNLFKTFLEKYCIDVWLVNTGWYGGTYGNGGQRYPLAFTRKCIRAVQTGEAKKSSFITDHYFSIQIPTDMNINPYSSDFLYPNKLWKNSQEYSSNANYLKNEFKKNEFKFK